MFVYSLLVIPLLYVLVRSLSRDRSDEAGFLAALVAGSIYALVQLMAGDIFDVTRAGASGVLNAVLDRTLIPVLLPVVFWLLASRFFPSAISLDVGQFVLLFLLVPGVARAVQDLRAHWPLDLVVLPSVKAGLVLSVAWLMGLAHGARGRAAMLFWGLTALAFVLAAGASAFAWLYRPFLAASCALPLLATALASLVLGLRRRG